MEIQIDQEFKNLIPPLSSEEYSQLEQNIIKDGCRDPLVLWNDTIVDGHNRYKICSDNNIEFQTILMDFDNREDVIEWMLYNQIGKRNAHANLMSYMRGRLYLQSKMGHSSEGNLKGQNVLSKTTAQKISENTNVSDKTIMRDAKFAQAVDVLHKYRNEILSGETLLTKQDIVAVSDFIQSAPSYYDVDTAVIYQNPSESKTLSKVFDKIASVDFSATTINELIKTDETKTEGGRELVLWKAESKSFDSEKYFFDELKSYSLSAVNDAEKKLLQYVKENTLYDVWKPLMSDAEYKDSLKAIEREKELLEIEKYTPYLRNGDTLKEITKIASESVDLIVTDPPYNMDKADWDSYGSGEEFADWAEQWLKECFRILKPTGSIYVFGINRMLSHIQMRMEQIGFNYKNWIIWDTIQGAGGGLWVNRQEAILYYSKTDKCYEDTDSIKLERAEENIREYKGKTYEFKNPSNIWRFPVVDNKHQDRTTHPTQKPVELIERIVKANSKENDTVLDCFMGSGTTGVATMKLRRYCIGFELSSEYISIAKDRFASVKVGDSI